MIEHFTGSDEKTAAKLVIHDEYLAAYTNILDGHWRTELWYIDTHAGTGKTTISRNSRYQV